jgi:hypothetical protein
MGYAHIRFSIGQLLVLTSFCGAGLTFYQYASGNWKNDPIGGIKRDYMWCFGAPPGHVYHPEDRVWISGPSDRDTIIWDDDF